MEQIKKLIKFSKDLETEEPNKPAYWHLQMLRIEMKQALNIQNVRQTLPKRLSNSAYIQATHKGYEDFMAWWDEQV